MNRSPHLSTLAAAAALCAFGAFAACDGKDGAGLENDPNLRTAARGDLPITVKEQAELQALRETIVRSEIEGQTAIISIIPEGTLVKQGEKLVELNVSELVEKRSNQKISVAKADAAFAQAKKEREILSKELTTLQNTAQSNLEIARMELEKLLGRASESSRAEGKNADMIKKLRELVQDEPSSPAPNGAPAANGAEPRGVQVTAVDPRSYAGLVERAQKLLIVADGTLAQALDREMGDMANRILQQTDKIRLAMAELKVKEDTYSHSRSLASKQFITRNELEKDQLAYQSQLSQVTLAWNDLDLLVNYTLAKEVIKLGQDYDNAKLELERVLASNEASVTRAESELTSRKAEFDLATERLQNLERQIASAVLYAPTPGLVVYARLERDRRGGEAVREGVQVRERQELIILPDTTRMRCVVKVQEAQVDKLKVGLPALIQVEARPNETFTGRVTSVAPVADSNSGWMTSDRKVYTTLVELDGENPDSRLKSRMAATVTIVVDTVKDTLPIPLQAVRRDRSVNYVWKLGPEGPVAVRVKVGQQNVQNVQILEGLEAGDRYFLEPPSGVKLPQFEQPVTPEPAPLEEVKKIVPGAAPAPGPATPTGPGNGSPTADGAPGANGANRGQRGQGRMAPPKPFAEMTAEELAQFKEQRLPFYKGMVDRARESGDEERATTLAEGIAALERALDGNDLAEAQAQADKLRASFRPNRGAGGGERGERGERGGNDRERPDRGDRDGARTDRADANGERRPGN